MSTPNNNDSTTTPLDGKTVHYSVDNYSNEVTITGVEVNNKADSEEVLQALDSAASVAETFESIGYTINLKH